MAYEPNVWKCGDTITADQLNRLEQAVAELSQSGGESGGALVLKRQEEQSIEGVILYDKTWQEVYDASVNGQLVMVSSALAYQTVSSVMVAYLTEVSEDDGYYAMFSTANDDGTNISVVTLDAPSADDYLRIQGANPSPSV